MEDILAGALLLGTSTLYLCAYIPLLVALRRLCKAQPSFIVFLSCSLGDSLGMLQLATFGLSIFLG